MKGSPLQASSPNGNTKNPKNMILNGDHLIAVNGEALKARLYCIVLYYIVLYSIYSVML